MVRGLEVCGKECGVWEGVEKCDGRGRGVWRQGWRCS